MSFIAGIISLNRILEAPKRLQFLNASNHMKRELSWPMEMVQTRASVLVHAGFQHMWQGPGILSNPKYDAVALGVQWREIPHHGSALDYLIKAVVSEECEIGNYFDYFNCAVVDKREDCVALATDPLGICPLLYMVDEHSLLFSSHQTFFRRFLGYDSHIDWQAVFEYLIIGHNMGNKTLLKNVHVLPPGSRLVCKGNRPRIVRYGPLLENIRSKEMMLEEAIDIIFSHLMVKCESYSGLGKKPFAGLLSGGWDSRLLISMFARTANMAMTYTTQQQIRFQKRLISEKRIAKEAAQFMGVNNLFVAPIYRTPQTRDRRARILDYATWFQDWAFTLAEKLPYDRYIFFDGLLGDILLRGLYITSDLYECMKNKDRGEAVRLLHTQYLRGFNAYTRGIESWKSVIHPHLLDSFSHMLLSHISEDINEIPNEDFVTVFLSRNRTRRGISPLPLLVFGMKGTMVFPFCDYEFLQKTLTIPMAFRLDHSLYKGLLERSKPGLSLIPSTNTKDFDGLGPYLTDSISDLSWQGQLLGKIKSFSPSIHRALTRRKTLDREKRNGRWAQEIIENPPSVFLDVLTSEVKNAIRDGNGASLKPYRFFLDRIKILDHFFS